MSSCTHGCRWGESSLGSCSPGAQDQDTSTGAPSQPHCHQATFPCPLLGLALNSPGSWGMLGHPRVPGWQGTISDGMQGAVCRIRPWSPLGKGAEAETGIPQLAEAPQAPLPGQWCPQARDKERRDSSTTASLARHPSPRRPYLLLMLHSSLPKACGLGKMLRDCICSKWIVSGGEQSTGEFSKQSCDRSPQERQAVPSGGTSLGTQQGVGSAPKPTGQQAGAPRLSPPGPGSAIPRWWPGRSCSTGAGQKTTAPFSPKNILLQNLASLQLQMKK